MTREKNLQKLIEICELQDRVIVLSDGVGGDSEYSHRMDNTGLPHISLGWTGHFAKPGCYQIVIHSYSGVHCDWLTPITVIQLSMQLNDTKAKLAFYGPMHSPPRSGDWYGVDVLGWSIRDMEPRLRSIVEIVDGAYVQKW